MAKKSIKKKNTNDQEMGGFRQRLVSVIGWFREKKFRWIGGLILAAALILFAASRIFGGGNSSDEFQTAPVERGDLIAIVGATGIVEPRQTADLNWQTNGSVEDVFYDVHDHVEEGAVLADLADNTLPQSVILAQADLVDARKELDELIKSNTESAEAYQNLLEAEQELRLEEDDRDQWNYNEASWDRVYAARAEFIRWDEEFKDAEEAAESVADLPEDNAERIEVEEYLDEVRFERDKALRNLNYILGKSYSQQVAEDFAEFDVALARVEDAQREWERIKDGPSADDIGAAEARVAAAEATVSLGWLEAPFDGTITRADPKPGDYVSSGTPGFRIDDLSELFVRVDISEVDINRVEVGQGVELSFDAITGETYAGEVTEVSSVGVDSGSGVDFEVTLRIIQPDEKVRAGMTAAVNIIVSEINDVLIVPNRAIRLNNGQRVVYILKDGDLEEVEVRTGASSDTETQILEGELAEGDLVVLNPPSFFQSNGGPPPFVRQ